MVLFSLVSKSKYRRTVIVLFSLMSKSKYSNGFVFTHVQYLFYVEKRGKRKENLTVMQVIS